MARAAKLARTEALTLAQLRRHLGTLLVLYGLLETLQVCEIINHHAPTAADVDHGRVGLDVSADGNIPTRYTLWPGRTADLATVQENVKRLCRLLRNHGWPEEEVTILLSIRLTTCEI